MSDILIGLVEDLMNEMEVNVDFITMQDMVLDYLEGLSFDDYDYFMDSRRELQIDMLKSHIQSIN